MPMEGDKLTADQKAFIKGWIAAGAPSTELPDCRSRRGRRD